MIEIANELALRALSITSFVLSVYAFREYFNGNVEKSTQLIAFACFFAITAK